MAKVRVTQVRSTIKKSKVQKDTITALKLGKINRSIEVELTPSLQGMLRVVHHLVTVTAL